MVSGCSAKFEASARRVRSWWAGTRAHGIADRERCEVQRGHDLTGRGLVQGRDDLHPVALRQFDLRVIVRSPEEGDRGLLGSEEVAAVARSDLVDGARDERCKGAKGSDERLPL